MGKRIFAAFLATIGLTGIANGAVGAYERTIERFAHLDSVDRPLILQVGEQEGIGKVAFCGVLGNIVSEMREDTEEKRYQNDCTFTLEKRMEMKGAYLRQINSRNDELYAGTGKEPLVAELTSSVNGESLAPQRGFEMPEALRTRRYDNGEVLMKYYSGEFTMYISDVPPAATCKGSEHAVLAGRSILAEWRGSEYLLLAGDQGFTIYESAPSGVEKEEDGTLKLTDGKSDSVLSTVFGSGNYIPVSDEVTAELTGVVGRGLDRVEIMSAERVSVEKDPAVTARYSW